MALADFSQNELRACVYEKRVLPWQLSKKSKKYIQPLKIKSFLLDFFRKNGYSYNTLFIETQFRSSLLNVLYDHLQRS